MAAYMRGEDKPDFHFSDTKFITAALHVSWHIFFSTSEKTMNGTDLPRNNYFSKSHLLLRLLAALMFMSLPPAAWSQEPVSGWGGKVQPPQYKGEIFPPWQHGANAPATNKGLEFTVPEVNVLSDFHGNLNNPKLVIFVAGNYYFAMAPLVAAFEKEHPQYKGRIFSETLPPGILLKQIHSGGTITVGNMTWTVKPDVFAAGLKKNQGRHC